MSTVGTIQLPRTGQKTCYDSSGTVISCAGTGQDGDIQAGVSWPDPRFINNGDGTVTDKLTGLMWTQDGNAPGPPACSPGTTKTWQGALDYVACLNTNSYLGYTDWHLPNVNELESLINAEQSNTAAWLNTQGFSNVQSNFYSSSTSGYDYPGSVWVVHMWDGHMDGNYKFDYDSYVWPVRSGQSIQTWFEEDDPAITYTGPWNSLVCNPCKNGFLKYSGQTGAKAEFSFYGTGIKWHTAKAPALGKAKIYFNNVYKGMVDLYSPNVQYPIVLGGSGLPPNNYTLTIEVSGQKKPNSNGYYIPIDAFEVIP